MDGQKDTGTFGMADSGGRQPRIGWIRQHSTGRKTGYDDADRFIGALEEAYAASLSGFSYGIATEDASVRKASTDLRYGADGVHSPYSLDDYGPAEGRNGIKGEITDKGTGERKVYYDSDEYVFELGRKLRKTEDMGRISFFTAAGNTAVTKAVDDAVRGALDLPGGHAFEECMRRQPMERGMCAGDYAAAYLADGARRRLKRFSADRKDAAGWVRMAGDDGPTYFGDADEFVRALRLELACDPDNADWGILKSEAAVRAAVLKAADGICGEESPFYIDEFGSDPPDSVKGRTCDPVTGGVTEYTDSGEYLEAVRAGMLAGPDAFSFETVTDNSAVWKELDGMADRMYGMYDGHGIEHSLARPKVRGPVTAAEYVRRRMSAGEAVEGPAKDPDAGRSRPAARADAEVPSGKRREKARMRDTGKGLPFPEAMKRAGEAETGKKRSVLAVLAESGGRGSGKKGRNGKTRTPGERKGRHPAAER